MLATPKINNSTYKTHPQSMSASARKSTPKPTVSASPKVPLPFPVMAAMSVPAPAPESSNTNMILFTCIIIVLVLLIAAVCYVGFKKSGSEKKGDTGAPGTAGSPGLPGSPGPTGPTGPAGANAPAQTVGLVGMSTVLKDPLQGSTGGETIIGPFNFLVPQTGLYNITFSVNVSPGKGPAVSLTGNLIRVPGNIAPKAVPVYSTAPPSSLSSSAITITGSTQQNLNAGDLAYLALFTTAPYTVYTINTQGSWFQYMLIAS